MFDIDKKNNDGMTALHLAVISNNPATVELLLKEYHANPNIVGDDNCTTLIIWACEKNRNLAILRLLLKYKFDLAKLINERLNKSRMSAFHFLCECRNTDHDIACLKYLFAVCKKIPNCFINILATNNRGVCGLHGAIWDTNLDMVRYLLENVYFPDDDKTNKNGVAFLNMHLTGDIPLGVFVILAFSRNQNTKCNLEIFKLLVSYGMKTNSKPSTSLDSAVIFQHVEIAEFILNQNLCPIQTMEEIATHMYIRCSNNNPRILKAVYNYGLEHGVICNKFHHSQLIYEAATCNLPSFKQTMSMILQKHGIKHLKQYKQCDMIDVTTLQTTIAQSSNIKPDVKSFIKALISDDETKLFKLSAAKEIVLTCINNHELKNSNYNKIINYQEMCPKCGDIGDGSQPLNGFECGECKSFICDDCIIVQKISNKVNKSSFGVHFDRYKSPILEEIFQYKDNKKLFNKVKLPKFVSTCFSLSFVD